MTKINEYKAQIILSTADERITECQMMKSFYDQVSWAKSK